VQHCMQVRLPLRPWACHANPATPHLARAFEPYTRRFQDPSGSSPQRDLRGARGDPRSRPCWRGLPGARTCQRPHAPFVARAISATRASAAPRGPAMSSAGGGGERAGKQKKHCRRLRRGQPIFIERPKCMACVCSVWSLIGGLAVWHTVQHAHSNLECGRGSSLRPA
jgi:hypothetical protein